MITIGFTNVFYTLWFVEAFEKHVEDGKRLVTTYNYMQNLSKDYDAAIAKVKELYPTHKIAIDLGLQGQHGSFEKVGEFVDTFEDHIFPFGRVRGTDMRTSDDAYHLDIQAREGREGRAAIATARLLELGIWVEFEGATMHANVARGIVIERERAERINGHFFKDGEKVTLTVKLIEQFGFSTQFGYTTVQVFQGVGKHIYKYMGSAPIEFEIGEEITITATVKHSDYRGEEETKLQRIKEVVVGKKRVTQQMWQKQLAKAVKKVYSDLPSMIVLDQCECRTFLQWSFDGSLKDLYNENLPLTQAAIKVVNRFEEVNPEFKF